MTTINGCDCDHYPGDDRINWLRQHGQFRVVGLYLAHSPGTSDQSWIVKRGWLASQGWGLIPTYAGLQIKSKQLSAANGTAHGQEAVTLMGQAGFPTSSVVYLDLEDGTIPSGSYADYVTAWVAAVSAGSYTPAVYCSHLLIGWVQKLTPIIWSFHIPSNTNGQTYDPDNLPTGLIDPQCIATQYRQEINLNGLTIPKSVDSGGLDLNLSLVADPSSVAAVHHALGL